MTIRLSVATLVFCLAALVFAQEPAPTVAVGKQAPAFQFKDQSGKDLNLAELTQKGPVLVRLTCGCLGCNKELPYFQEVQRAYEGQGLTSLAVFREPDTKVEAYVREKHLNMLYAVDPKGQSWGVFKTKTMPSNFLIEKGGKIAAIATGCDTSGLLAGRISEKAAALTGSETVDVKAKVVAQQAAQAAPSK